MGVVNTEDIAGVSLRDQVLCTGCAGKFTDYAEEDFIFSSEIDKGETLYYCDKCKEVIT